MAENRIPTQKSMVSTVKIEKKYLLTYQFFDVNGVNGSIRKPSNGAFEVFDWHIYVFSVVNGVNSKVEKHLGFE